MNYCSCVKRGVYVREGLGVDIRNTHYTSVLDCLLFREMGKRKSKRKAPPKRKATGPLDTLFTCPFCNHEKSCEVKMYVDIK